MQTFLVHSRDPLRNVFELGVRGTVIYHLAISAIVVSMVSHPAFLAIAAWEFARLATGGPADAVTAGVVAVSVFNLVGGYTSWIFFARAILARQGAKASWMLLLSLPAYWLLISLAGWRALWQLATDPFHWEKTRHGLAKRRDFADILGKP